MLTATSDSLAVDVFRDGIRDTSHVELPIAAWRLNDGGVLAMVSEMTLTAVETVDALGLCAAVRSVWPDAQILERRPRDGVSGYDPRSCAAEYIEVRPDGTRAEPDYEVLETRGFRLSRR